MTPRPPFDAARLEALFGPLKHHARIGLAVSGGPDSLALMMLYAAWRPAGPKPDAIVYSVDHGLRPAQVRDGVGAGDIAFTQCGHRAAFKQWAAGAAVDTEAGFERGQPLLAQFQCVEAEQGVRCGATEAQ